MSSDSKSYRVQIIVAVIGLVGVIGASVIANWDKLVGSNGGGKTVTYSQTSNKPGDTVAPKTTWQQQSSYDGDCRSRPAGTVCAKFEDGYVWLVRGSISGWEKRVEDGQTIQVAITSTGRYEHTLDTNHIRIVR